MPPRGNRHGPQDPRVDAYIAKAAPFARPLLARLRAAVHRACPDCEETIRWGAPSFSYRGRILCGMSAFKQHAAFWLWQGGPTTGREGEAMGQFGRLQRAEDLPADEVLAEAVQAGMCLIEAGVKRSAGRSPAASGEPPVPADLAAAFEGNARAKGHFDAFPQGARRDYIAWITEAKRAETRSRRVAQAVAWIADNERRNWKYEKR